MDLVVNVLILKQIQTTGGIHVCYVGNNIHDGCNAFTELNLIKPPNKCTLA